MPEIPLELCPVFSECICTSEFAIAKCTIPGLVSNRGAKVSDRGIKGIGAVIVYKYLLHMHIYFIFTVFPI